ncbi:MAG: radical SAM protein [Candidatus Lokiarchaeota archaeon]
MNFLYGPVPSRRLGRSLGIDPLPSKTCNYQCVYCQLGRTTNFTNKRMNYFKKEEIYQEMEDGIPISEGKFDFITFVGSGEPLLYRDIGDLILKAKTLSKKPICLITNGSLLFQEDVQNQLLSSNLDVILPTLDAGVDKTFIKINRPHPSIKFSKMVDGLIDFRNKFSGKFWLEVMLVKDINDSKKELEKIKEKIDLINPHRIDINIPIRPPAEPWVKKPDKSIYYHLNEIFGNYSNINFPEKGQFETFSGDFKKELLNIIERHPMSQDQILDTFSSDNFPKTSILKNLNNFEREGIIQKIKYEDRIFWKLV